MKNILGALALTLTLFLTSCGGSSLADPQAFYQEAIQKAANMTAYESNVNITGTIDSVAEKKNMSIDMDLATKTDVSNIENIKSDIAIKLNLNGNIFDETKIENLSTDLGLRVIGTLLFLRIDDLQVPSDSNAAAYTSMLNLIKGKWLKIPDEAINQQDLNVGAILTDTKNSMFTVINNLFSFQEYKGLENGNHTFSITLDKQALKQTIIDENKAKGVEMSAEEQTKLDESLDVLAINASISINDNQDVTGLLLDITGNNLDNGVSLDLVISTDISNINQTIEIDEPTDTIDLANFFGGM